MKNITCVIVEDEPYAQNLIESYIEKTPKLKLIKTFSHPLEAIDKINELSPDLIFLDIEMPEISGMNLVELLDDPTGVIFTTAYSEYAVESYEKEVLDYLLKPITYERFLKAVNKYKSLVKEDVSKVEKTEQHKIFLKSESNFVGVDFDDILYIEGLGDYVTFYTAEGKIVVYHTLKKLENLLPDQFMRTHYSYIVNFNHIKKAGKNGVFIVNKEIPVSKSYKEQYLKRIKDQLI